MYSPKSRPNERDRELIELSSHGNLRFQSSLRFLGGTKKAVGSAREHRMTMDFFKCRGEEQNMAVARTIAQSLGINAVFDPWAL